MTEHFLDIRNFSFERKRTICAVNTVQIARLLFFFGATSRSRAWTSLNAKKL